MDAPLKFVDEITGSLRELKPEGHLAVDRFKSLQKRNIIEPRVKSKMQPGPKVKRFMTRDKRKFAAELGLEHAKLYKKLKWH
jgi:nucleolar protein 53